MGIANRVATGLAFIERSFFRICGLFMCGLMVVGAADVILNNTIGFGIPGAIDIAQALFVSCVFLALPFVVRMDEHIKVDLFTSRFPKGGKKAASTFAAVVGVLVYFLLAYAMWDLFVASWRVKEQSLSVVTFPIYPVKLLACAGLALAVASGVVQTVGVIRSRD